MHLAWICYAQTDNSYRVVARRERQFMESAVNGTFPVTHRQHSNIVTYRYILLIDTFGLLHTYCPVC